MPNNFVVDSETHIINGVDVFETQRNNKAMIVFKTKI
jgi:hypothetical protein